MPLSYSLGSSYGWRARIGLLQPGVVSDTNPFEFYLMAPPGVQMVLTSLGLGGMSTENYDRALATIETPVKRLVDRHVDAIIQTGVPPLVTAGWGIEPQLAARVAQLTPVPYWTDVAASIRALRAVGTSKIGVVSGFDDTLVDLMRAYLRHADIGLIDHTRVRNGNDLPLEDVYRAAREVSRRQSEIDGIWLTMASIPSVGIIDILERDLGMPVISSAQALMWAGMRSAGVGDHQDELGRLFQLNLPPD